MMPAKWQQRIDLALLGVAIVCLGISLILKVYVSTLPQIGRVSLKPISHMTRADLFFLKTDWEPSAVIILSPGYNGNGKEFLYDRHWYEFAKHYRLGIVGLSFASQEIDLHNGKGYYYVKNGSGELLLEGLRHIYGQDLPLLLYGFSGGAHFTARLAEWQPSRIIAWCAYSAGWWDEPLPMENPPPGIIACGDNDSRWSPSFEYYQKGRKLERPWLWVSIKDGQHEMSPELEAFVRNCFATFLESSSYDKAKKMYGKKCMPSEPHGEVNIGSGALEEIELGEK